MVMMVVAVVVVVVVVVGVMVVMVVMVMVEVVVVVVMVVAVVGVFFFLRGAHCMTHSVPRCYSTVQAAAAGLLRGHWSDRGCWPILATLESPGGLRVACLLVGKAIPTQWMRRLLRVQCCCRSVG